MQSDRTETRLDDDLHFINTVICHEKVYVNDCPNLKIGCFAEAVVNTILLYIYIYILYVCTYVFIYPRVYLSGCCLSANSNVAGSDFDYTPGHVNGDV